ncbi:MAG: HlyD family efflux transporter periplasmic adaptor subunit [Spirochaetales bacterium]|nr:HlyD family efflux transporter periplasmic adaptor subunit [Spirochaetales bacterium]
MKISGSALMKTGAALIILAGGITAMELLASSKAEAHKREVEAPVRKVETMVPRFADQAYLVHGNGLIESAGRLQISSVVSGEVEYSFNGLISGTYAEKDQLLLKIDSRQAENTLNLARSELIKAVAALVPQFKSSDGELYSKWNRYLATLDFTSGETPDLPASSGSREKLLISTYGIYSAFYNVRNAEIMVEHHSFYAPADGFIRSEGIRENSFVSAGQPLFSLVDAENLEISVPLTVEELNRIDCDSRPSVTILSPGENGSVLNGRVVSCDVELNRASQMIDVLIRFANPRLNPGFAPGNYVDVLIDGRLMANTAAVPRHAVLENSFVYTYEDGVLGKENVAIRAVSDDSVYIENTLPPGTEIVTTILQKPLVGMKLSPVGDEDNAELAAAAEAGNHEKDS